MHLFSLVKKFLNRLRSNLYQKQFKHTCHSSRINYTVIVYNPDNLFMDENTNIDAGGVIMNTRAKFIMKKNSGAAIGLLAITGNHMSIVGKNLKQVTDRVKDEIDVNKEMDRDIVVDEDVWIGSHVTLLSGSHLGRGCEVGAGSVVRGNVPPYSIVIGNPCKVVGFRFSPEEIIEHEKIQYDEADRFSMDFLQSIYEKFFLNRIQDIKLYTRI